MKMRIITLLFMLVFSAVSGSAMTALGSPDKTIVVVDEAYPPYMFGTTEQAKGLYPELIKAVFARMGAQVEIRALPWEEALKAGEEGAAAVGGIYRNDARTKIYDYSEPLFEEHLAVYVKKGKAFQFSGLSDLQGKTIGLLHGWSYGEAFDAARARYQFTVEAVHSDAENFRNLLSGKVDCVIADHVAASRVVRKENWSDRVEQLGQLAAVNKAYLAFAKSLKKETVLAAFNQALAEMKNDGSYEKLVRDFMNNASR